MVDTSPKVIVATFPDEYGAISALELLKSETNDAALVIDDAAVLRRTGEGVLETREVDSHRHVRKGALIGGASGAVVGLLAGPVGWLAGLGALAGGLAGKRRDSGIKDHRFRKFGDSLAPGTSAVVVVAHGEELARIERDLANVGATVLTEPVPTDAVGQL